MWNTRLDIGVFWQWAIIGGVVVEPYFKGIQPVKRIKRIVHFIITLFWRYWTINRHQINLIYEDTCTCRWHRIFGSVYMPSIGDSWPIEEVTKNIFSTSNTSHLIIMMISVVLCKINEKMNYLSIFHDHVVRMWLRNWPAKLSWNRNENSLLQMLCLEYIVWYGQFVTNWCDFIETPFNST